MEKYIGLRVKWSECHDQIDPEYINEDSYPELFTKYSGEVMDINKSFWGGTRAVVKTDCGKLMEVSIKKLNIS